jgi:serine protein kinase
MSITALAARVAEKYETVALSVEQWYEQAASAPDMYAGVHARLLKAIGDPIIIDTKADARLSRIFSGRKIRVYEPFKDFFGIEETIDEIISKLRAGAQNQEPARQVLDLVGPVGSAKSSLARRLVSLIEKEPIWVVATAKGDVSPVNDNPLAFLRLLGDAESLCKDFNIPVSVMSKVFPSPWLVQQFKDAKSDLTKFQIRKVYPSVLESIAVARIEPGDENNQDISTIVGKTDLRSLEKYPQEHPYSYSYSGGLCRANRGVAEFVEIFKAPTKALHPILTATQEYIYNGTENIGALPFDGLIIAHHNSSEWDEFRTNPKNEAFLDRLCVVQVPYTLRHAEEAAIYKKMIDQSTTPNVPIAPGTIEMLAKWSVLSRLSAPANSSIIAKLHVYNGENVKDRMPTAKPIGEYRDAAGLHEGMTGMSTRFAFKVLADTFDLRPEEMQANPVDLMFVLQEAIKKDSTLADARREELLNFIESHLKVEYFELLDKQLREAYMESFGAYGQNMFDRYVSLAAAWIDAEVIRDPETHMTLDRQAINGKLEEIERPAGVMNVSDFRHNIVTYVLRYQARNAGASPRWQDYEKIKTVIEKKLFTGTQNILPVISFGTKQDSEIESKHHAFVDRMIAMGYTKHQIEILVAWWSANTKAA